MEMVDAYHLKVLWSYGGIVLNFLLLIVCFSFLYFNRKAEIILICIGSVLHFLSSLVSLLGYGVLSSADNPAYFGENEIYFLSNALYTIGTIILYIGIVVLFVRYIRMSRKITQEENVKT